MRGGDPHLEMERWPIVVVRVPAVMVEADLEPFLGTYASTVFGRKERHVLILDATALAEMPSARTRQTLGAWRRAHADRLTAYSAGTAIVSTSLLARGAATAIQWIAPVPIEITFAPTVAVATRWAYGQLEKRGVAGARR